MFQFDSIYSDEIAPDTEESTTKIDIPSPSTETLVNSTEIPKKNCRIEHHQDRFAIRFRGNFAKESINQHFNIKDYTKRKIDCKRWKWYEIGRWHRNQSVINCLFDHWRNFNWNGFSAFIYFNSNRKKIHHIWERNLILISFITSIV